MKSMTNICKKTMYFMLIFVLMLSGLSLTARADDVTKTVTYEKAYTFVITPSQFPTYMYSASSCVPSTYNYDDGLYKGTLSLSYAGCSSPTPTGNPVGSMLQVTITATYSGTVTIRSSKTVTYEKAYTFVITPSQFPTYMYSASSCVPSTYNYDDGLYKGTLSLSYAGCSSPTPTGNPVGSMLQVTITATYTGTVYEK